MKNRNFLAAIFLLLTFAASIFAQLPQYYNFNTTGTNNSFPFGIPTGKMLQAIALSGELNQPTPAPSGTITKFYYRVNDLYPFSNVTYSFLYIRMGQSSITTLPTGAFYTGTMDTVFKGTNYLINAAGGTWVVFNLTTPFTYNNTQSLIIEIGNFGHGSAAFYPACNTTLTGNRRNYSVGGPPFVYSGQGAQMMACGVDISTAPPACNYAWTAQTSGTTSLLYSVKAVNDLVCWTVGAAATVRRTTDGGANWTNGNPNPGVITGDIYNIEAIDANTAWVTTTPTATFIYKTTNGGTNWTQVYTLAGGFINAIKMTSPLIGYATGDVLAGVWVILRTTDGGSTWATLSSPAGTGDGRNNSLQVMLPNIWFGTGQGSIWRSTDSGLNWAGVATTGLAGQVLAVHFNSPTNGLGGGATMVKSTDGGGTYALLPASGTGNISGIQGLDSNFWYCRGTGIFRSTNLGVNWTQVHTPVGTQNDLSFATGGNGCLAGWSVGSGGNIAKMTGTPVGISNNNNQIPDSYRLEQNYPNPFNPTTTITFGLPKSGLTKLIIYDILGKVVTSLVNEFKNAGTYSVNFDGTNQSSGLYFYTLENGSFKETKKMILIK